MGHSVLSILNFTYILSLVFWVGGIAFFSFIAAPAIFKILEREKAGQVVGVIFPRYYLIGYISALIALFSLLVSTQEFIGSKQILLYIMIVGWFYAGLVISPKSKNLKSLKLSASSMEEKELLEVKFKKAHSLAVKLNGTVFLLGLGLLWFSALGFEL